LTAQEAMLTNDEAIEKNNRGWWRRNTVGYSRLYDISTQMFTRVAGDYLSAPAAKATVLHELLLKQCKFNIEMFERRLPDKNGLKQKITHKCA